MTSSDSILLSLIILTLCGREYPFLCRLLLSPISMGNQVSPHYMYTLRPRGRSGDRIPMGTRFSTPVQTGPGAHRASYTMGTWSFPGVKRPGRGVDHPFPSSTEVKERVELCLYSTSGSSWLVIGWTSVRVGLRERWLYVFPRISWEGSFFGAPTDVNEWIKRQARKLFWAPAWLQGPDYCPLSLWRLTTTLVAVPHR